MDYGMYGNQYQQPMYNPYQQPQYNMYQQPVQKPAMHGKVVNSVAEIAVQDVPSDGSWSWFPLADNSEVIAKKWNPDGTIATVSYRMTAQPAPEPTQADRIEEKLNKLISILDDMEVEVENA